VPDEWDWTEKEAVTTVKDQGTCDAAWAMAVVASVESYYAIKHKELKDLSV